MALTQLLGTDKVSPTGKQKINNIITKLLGGYPGQVLVSQGDGVSDPQWQDIPDPTYADTAGVASLATVATKANSIDAGDYNFAVKYVYIGSWDMVSSSTQSVVHGLDFDSILSVSQIMIVNDDDTLKLDLCTPAGTFVSSNGLFSVSTTTIDMQRRSGSVFDTTDFDDGTKNRGWIEIKYQV